MSVKARMKVGRIVDHGGAKEVHLAPVYSDDKSSPNYSYSQATPSGAVSLMITNPGAFDQFAVGKTFDIEFTEYAPVAAA